MKIFTNHNHKQGCEQRVLEYWKYHHMNVFSTDPLRFLIEPRNQTAFINESVWFHCAATGRPKPKITWLKADQGGRPLNEEKYRAYANGSLRIKDVQYSDMGRYFCLVATRTDLRQRTVHLEVKGSVICPINWGFRVTDHLLLPWVTILLYLHWERSANVDLGELRGGAGASQLPWNLNWSIFSAVCCQAHPISVEKGRVVT